MSLLTKQRGIYSETINPHNAQEFKEIINGPSENIVLTITQRQKLLPAISHSQSVKSLAAKQAWINQKQLMSPVNPRVKYYNQVLEPFDPIPGQVPRKVAIERKKKLFTSYNLNQLLEQQKINFNQRDQLCQWLPLTMFDDLSFDDHQASKWIERQVDQQRVFHPLTGRGLYKDSKQRFRYRKLVIQNYNERQQKFQGYWLKSQQEVHLNRLFICFDAQDPRKYIKRIKKATQQRRYTDALIRYNNIIDNMPLDDLTQLDTQQKKRILNMLSRFKDKEAINFNVVINQINSDFKRTMCKIIFDTYLKQNPDQLTDLKNRLPPKQIQKEVAQYGMQQLESSKGAKQIHMYTHKQKYPLTPKKFTEIYKEFCFATLLGQKVVAKALQDIRKKCHQVDKLPIFQFNIQQPLHLDQFKHMQQNIQNQTIYYLKGTWIPEMIKIIRGQFTDVGKGWFNMKQTSKITYDFGKLKKFMTVLRLLMQDTIYDMIRQNYQKYYKYICSFIPKKTIIKSSYEVINEFDEPKGSRYYPKINHIPLFQVQLIKTADNLISYNTKEINFVHVIMICFTKALDQMAKIPDLEPTILSDLYKSQKLQTYIKSPIKPKQRPIDPDPNQRPKKYPDQNKWLFQLYQQLELKARQAIEPLSQYLQYLSPYCPKLKINPDQYVKNLEMEQVPRQIQSYRDQINSLIKQKERLKVQIPQKIHLGIFQIHCKEIIGHLEETNNGLIKNLVTLIAKMARQKTLICFNKYDTILKNLNQQPKNIQQLTQLTSYIQNLPLIMQKIKSQVNNCFQIFQILQKFNYRYTTQEFKRRWKVFGFPKDINNVVHQREKALDKLKAKFLQEMKQSQKVFQSTYLNLQQTISDFYYYQDISDYQSVYQNVVIVNTDIQKYLQQAKKFNNHQYLFGLTQLTDYSKINQMARQFQPYSNLWTIVHDWIQKQKEWMDGQWAALNVQDAQRFMEDGIKMLNGVIRYMKDKEIKSVFKIAEQIRQQMDKFKPKVPVLTALKKKGLKQTHTKQISQLIGQHFQPDEHFTFREALQMGIMAHTQKIVQIGERAGKQYQIEVMLENMIKQWQLINFQIVPYKAVKQQKNILQKQGTYIIRSYEDISNKLQEHIINTQAMQFSPYKKPFQQDIIRWDKNLRLMSDVLQEWMKFQQQWMYLQPIFDSHDIAKQLPQESKRFKTVDHTWKYSMNQVKSILNVLKCTTQQGLLERIRQANKNLEMIQKQLNNYLQKKRQKFARFYFLSNGELLQILSQAKQPTAVQPHLKKVFQNINRIQFTNQKKIICMLSQQKQKIEFVKMIDPNKKNVQDWMGQLQSMMKKSIRNVFLKGIQSYWKQKRTEWVLKNPGQIVLNANQTAWTKQVQQAIQIRGNVQQQIPNGISQYFVKVQKQLLELVGLVRTITDSQHRTTLSALIVIDVHAKDVVDNLNKLNIQQISAFEWISQLRYYFVQDLFVRCIQTNFPYGYQYLGNTTRLVITPLTDKCYMTLMSALKLNLGGAPAGPAGTGKTETTKDLAKALAKQCVVFNCSDTMDYLMVGKFFKGLASAGAWACFDQFNRINIQVLSVVAQQLLVLFGQKGKGTTSVYFQQSTIKLNPTFSVFITMNPGYAGRTQLPDNLKALFRSVAMMVPDYAMIGQILLYSFGFQMGRDLARKMVATFKLSSQQLSSQYHYDFGMRAVRSVINAAGLLKSAYQDMNEQQLLLRALRDVNVPKFLKDDLPLFQSIISDLFPRVQKPTYNYGQLLPSIEQRCKQLNLQSIKPFVDKVLQLYDTIQVRHGLMLVGQTGGGKTSNYRVLANSLTALKNQGYYKVNTHVLNPKSITMGQLYGQFSQQSHQWTQGILANIVRQTVRDTSGQKHWIMFDGPVDAIWIQSMNTVLDDNKKLCLNSGQILVLTSHIVMMFEVQDLAVASPATVSRCGMVYLQPAALGLQVLITSYFGTLNKQLINKKPNLIKNLDKFFLQNLQETLQFKRKYIKQIIPSIDNNLLQSCMRIINCFLVEYHDTQFKRVMPDQYQILQKNMEAYFTFAFIWSVMCTSDRKGREKYNLFWRRRSTKHPFPQQFSIYQYYFDRNDNCWKPWKTLFQNFQINPKLSYHQIAIPTTDSTRNKFILKMLITNKYHILCPGPTGTGKTLNVMSLMTTELSDMYQYITLSFSAQTSANQTQDTIDIRMDKRTKRKYGPTLGKRCIVFIDDLNMPKKEKYNAQPPIQLIRQFLDHKGWYNRKQLFFMFIEDVYVISSMGPPGGGRTNITPRVIRHFNVLTYTQLQHSVIMQIFSRLCNHFFKKFQEQIKKLINHAVECTLLTYEQIRQKFLPTPSKSHYTFNLRDLGKVFQGLCSLPKVYTNPIYFHRLIFHQQCRVFHDRLTTNEDRQKLIEMVQKMIPSDYLGNLYNGQQRIIFCDFLKGRQDDRAYLFVQQIETYIELIEKFQDDFVDVYSKNSSDGKKSARLVLFLDACQHIARICRILRNPKGNALLLGVGGSGRQSLSRLSIFLCDYRNDQIQVVKNYSIRNWRQHIKGLLMKAGIDNRPITFLFVDTQIIHEQMMEDLNNILNSGDVTGIYVDKDHEDILSACKQDCMKAGLHPTKMNVFTIYLERVKKNLHVIMAMSPIGQAFTTRLRMFPALVNCCTINWFSEWPQQALIGVGKGQLIEFQQQLGIKGQLQKLVQMFNKSHKFIENLSIKYKNELRRNNYVTPTSYLELLSLYREILKNKKQELKRQINRLSSGLDKLHYANQEVEKMRIQLKQKQPKLILAQEETNKMMVELQADKAQAKQVQKKVMNEQQVATIATQKALKLQKEVQTKVKQAKQKLDEVATKMQQIKPAHISQLKTFGKATPTMSLVLQGACYLFRQKIIVNADKLTGKKQQDPFQTAKTTFLKMDPKALVQRMVTYKVQKQMDDRMIQKLQANVVYKDKFNQTDAGNASFVIKYMFLWVDACYTYYIDWKNTQPLRLKQKQVQAQVLQKEAKLNQVKLLLQKTNQRIEVLQKTYDEKAKEIKRLTADIQMCKIKLQRAQKLTDGLKDQKQRWTQDVTKLKDSQQFFPGNAILAAAMISYSGPFTSTYRQQCQKTWIKQMKKLNIKHSQDISMRKFLGDQVKIQTWNIAGLPKDDTSIQNGIIIDKTRRWPLMIDPQGQASKFLRSILTNAQFGYEVIKITDPLLMKELQIAIQFGRWFLVEKVGLQLDPSLDPILLQQVQKSSSGQKMISLGKQKNLVYHQSFRFFMTTTIANPHYSPQTSAKVTIINFAITKLGLEQQMLANAVALEAPNLQNKKTQIVRKNAYDKKQLINIEDQILKCLTEAENIQVLLKDQSLINKLQNSKKVTTQINQRVKDSKVTQAQIDKNRQSYRPVAYRASLLFFCINDLSIIDPMYQYSLQWFVNLFRMSVQNAQKDDSLQKRLVNLNQFFTYSLYQNICRSLFQKHKLLFSFLLTQRILEGDNQIDKVQWRYLLTGPTGEIQIKKNPTLKGQIGWISESSWPDIYRNIYGMNCLPGLEFIQPYFMKYIDQFRPVYQSNNPGGIVLPSQFSKITDLQKILFIKCLRPDKMILQIQKWITNKLQQKFIVVQPLDIEKCYSDSVALTPLIFVLSPGSDPVSDFLKFAQNKGMIRRFQSISLGQGQGERAKRLIADANTKGNWVLLQNCHLATSWMLHLQQIVEQLNQTTNKDFRLWLTSMPSDSFPISVLQNGVKMTLQPPKGIKSNLLRSYMNLSNRQLNQCKKPQAFKKLLFSFCMFHAVVQQRRKYGPIGWNIMYQFTNEDLDVCKKQLKLLLDQYDKIPYQVINYLGSQIYYGGRVTDDKDVRLIITILRGFINSDALKDNYKFSSLEQYISPPATTQAEYIAFIQGLPLQAAPQLFGLHANAAITNAQNQTIQMLSAVLSMQPRTTAGTGKSRQQIIEQIVQFIENRMPQRFDIEMVQKRYPTDYNQSMNTVLLQQIIRYERLLQVMAESLIQLKKALKGFVVMSEQLQRIANSLYDNQVPNFWAQKGFLSLKPLSLWTQDLKERVDFLQKWIINDTPNIYWISGFFFPQAFITGTLQNYARKYQIQIDKLSFDFHYLKEKYQEIQSPPQDGCYVYGIFLEGCTLARTDKKKAYIKQPKPKELYSELPVLHLLPIVDRPIVTQGKLKQQEIYLCPTYKVVSRRGTLSTTGHSTNFVLFIELPSKQAQDSWIKAGVAAFLSLRY